MNSPTSTVFEKDFCHMILPWTKNLTVASNFKAETLVTNSIVTQGHIDVSVIPVYDMNLHDTCLTTLETQEHDGF